ncbi:MAG TPA: hypothetical protein PKO06_16400, partial [Candidatus Ozemobacteraceae bacterium]|nr:hypothetical protein [Candidatus Ozemobacteraceae bacterium]
MVRSFAGRALLAALLVVVSFAFLGCGGGGGGGGDTGNPLVAIPATNNLQAPVNQPLTQVQQALGVMQPLANQALAGRFTNGLVGAVRANAVRASVAGGEPTIVPVVGNQALNIKGLMNKFMNQLPSAAVKSVPGVGSVDASFKVEFTATTLDVTFYDDDGTTVVETVKATGVTVTGDADRISKVVMGEGTTIVRDDKVTGDKATIVWKGGMTASVEYKQVEGVWTETAIVTPAADGSAFIFEVTYVDKDG